jgi:ER lumen protein retaining receptor
MKIFFIASSLGTLYLMKVKFKNSWDPKLDTMRVEFLIAPAAVFALLVHYKGTVQLTQVLTSHTGNHISNWR